MPSETTHILTSKSEVVIIYLNEKLSVGILRVAIENPLSHKPVNENHLNKFFCLFHYVKQYKLCC